MLSRQALTIPIECRLAAARAALQPIPAEWPARHAEAQAEHLARGEWGIELSDHAANATGRMRAVLCAMGYERQLSEYERPYPYGQETQQ